MPKLIDHEQRERAIASAAWTVLTRDGLLAMSVRNVADEAGLATASLRRAFPTQAALRVYCLEQVREHVTHRIGAISSEQEPLDYAQAVLWELLPLDDQRCTELEVQMILGSLAFTDPAVAQASARADRDLADLCARLIEVVAPGRADARQEADARLEADSLHALLDGVALHLLRHPDRANRAVQARARGVLRRHLALLAE